jgi:HK97 family phage major capsid protein
VAAPYDVSTLTPGVYLPPELSGEIWQNVQENSVVQQLAGRMDLPGGGVAVDIITGDPVAEFVGETGQKPVSNPSVDSKLVYPHTIAVIETFSNKFRNNKNALYNALQARLPNALARRFDAAVLYGEGAPTTNFDTLEDAPSVDVATSPYAGLLTALGSVVDEQADITGWAISPQAELVFLGQTDTLGRPLFVDGVNNSGSIPRLLNRTAVKSRYVGRPAVTGGTPKPATFGFGGDWSQATVGIADPISIDINTKGSVTLPDGSIINLWQRNMFAVRVEVEIGFRYRDVNRFVRLTGA